MPAAGPDPLALPATGGTLAEDDPFAMPGAPVFEAYTPDAAGADAFAMPAAGPDPFALPATGGTMAEDDPFAMPGALVFEALPGDAGDPFAMPATGGAAAEDDPFAMPGAPVFEAFTPDATPAEVPPRDEVDAFPAFEMPAADVDDPFALPEGGIEFPPLVPVAEDPAPLPAVEPLPAAAPEPVAAPVEATVAAAVPPVVAAPVVAAAAVAAAAVVVAAAAPAAPAPVAAEGAGDAAFGLEGVLKSAEERKKLHAELNGIVTTLNDEIDQVQTSLAGLYGELQKAAVRRAAVADITRITEQIGQSRQRVAEGSEAHKQALYMRQVADAYLALMGEL
jgi:Skp family chaperone for outer membrane proteins